MNLGRSSRESAQVEAIWGAGSSGASGGEWVIYFDLWLLTRADFFIQLEHFFQSLIAGFLRINIHASAAPTKINSSYQIIARLCLLYALYT